jgi:tetratricopeptide (TPR) repeat protein
LQLFKVAGDRISGRQQAEWMTCIEQEMDNLRAVLKWLSHHAPDEGLGMALNLYWLWQSTSYLQEGRNWLGLMLAQPESVSAVLRAEAYAIAGFFDIMRNKIEDAEGLFAQSFALYQQLDPTDRQVREGVANVLNYQGLGLIFRGDYPQAEQLCRQSLAIAQQIDNPWEVHSALSFISEALYHQGLLAEARHTYTEGLALCEAHGFQRAVGRAWIRLGNVACAQGDLIQTSIALTNGLRVATECHDLVGIGMALGGLASEAALRGAYRQAALLLAAKEESATTNPVVRFWPLERKEKERLLVLLHGHLDDTTFATVWAEGRAMSLEQAVAYALADAPA